MCCIINSEIYSSVCGYNNSKLIKQCEIFQQKNLLKNVSHLISILCSCWRCVCCWKMERSDVCWISMINAVLFAISFVPLIAIGDQRTIVKTHKNTCKKNRSSTSQNDIFLLFHSPFTSILCFMKFLSQFSLFYRLLTINCLCCFSRSPFPSLYLFPKKYHLYI